MAACGGEGLDRLADGGRAQATRALSGEVVQLQDGGAVRLAGVEVAGPAAEARLDELVRGRELALLQGGGGPDAYGRPVAHLRRLGDRRWIQGVLLEEGLARVRTTQDQAVLAREMLRREARARVRNRGLWADPAFRVRLPGEVGRDARGFLIVEGRVVRIERRPQGVDLKFGPGADGFVVQIPRPYLRDMESLGDLDDLQGRLVRARGVVQPTLSGPVMRVDHPEQIEVLTVPN